MKAKTGKAWRLTYRTVINHRGKMQSWVFLTVAEALEHAALLQLSKFHLTDFVTPVH